MQHMVLTLAQTEHDRDTTSVLLMYSVQKGGYCMSCKTSGTDGTLSSYFKYITYSTGTANIPPHSTQILSSVAHRKKSMTIWHSPVRDFFSVSSDSNHRLFVALF